jgi:hypothetical protein
MEQKLMEKDSSKRQQHIDNEMYLAREKALADANYYRHVTGITIFFYTFFCSCITYFYALY